MRGTNQKLRKYVTAEKKQIQEDAQNENERQRKTWRSPFFRFIWP